MSWLAFACAYAGVAGFAATMAVHQRRFLRLRSSRLLVCGGRAGGTTMLLAALLFALHAFGGQVGAVAWVAMVAVSGFLLTQFLAFAPRFAFVPAGALLLPAIAVSIVS